jgi:ubiquinone/menaquinone biosynthesis C-methylase UbiE
MSYQENKQQWEALGQLDPFWAMTGTNKYGAWDLEAFLQTGDQQVAQLMRDASRFERPTRYEAVLDFGCGAGRLTRAFRAHFERYLGLDISENLVAKAREVHAALPGTSFALSPRHKLDVANDSQDMVYAWAVLQHIADRAVVLHLLAEFVRVLRPGGLLVFSAMHHIQLFYRLQPRRRLYALLRAAGVPDSVLYHRLRLYPQEVHFVPQAQVVSHLQSVGAQVLEVKAAAPAAAPHQVRVYYVTK